MNTNAQAPVAPSRAAAASGPGVSWRSAFISRRTPKPFCAEPNSTGTICPCAGLLGEVLEHGLPVGDLVHQQLLEQDVVMVGELLEHMGPLQRLAVGEVGGDLLLLGGLAGPVIISALERDIDEAGNLLAVADRDPARDQRRFRHRLQRLQQRLDRAARLIDLVDEDHVRDAELLEPPQRRLGEQGAGGVGIDDDEGEVGRRHAERAVGGKAHRPRRIDQRVAVVQIVEMHQVEFGRAAARARLGAGVADAAAVGDMALPPDRAGGKKKGLGEAGLAGPAGAHERDGSGAGSSGGHIRLLGSAARLREEDAAARPHGETSRLHPSGAKCKGGIRRLVPLPRRNRRLPQRSTSPKSLP